MIEIHKLYNKTDEELVQYARNNDECAYNILIERYMNYIQNISKNYFAIGAETIDLQQEGLIGLYLAIKNFDLKRDIKFKTFANICIKRKLISYIKTSNRKKNVLINDSISLDEKINSSSEDNELLFKDIIRDISTQDPCYMLAENEYLEDIKTSIFNSLSSREKAVLNEYIKGKKYIEIANNLNLNVKSVDTALTRIRRKANEIKLNYGVS